MRKILGVCCILLGICCLIASLGWIVYNRWEEENAQHATQNILQDVRKTISDNKREEISPDENIPEETPPKANDPEIIPEIPPDTPSDIPSDTPREMLTTPVDGYACIGVLSIPVLELELPVLTDWSYAKLKVAPCHYFGSYYEKNFVIAAHNYRAHFARLSELQPKDLILFTDISDNVYYYEVVLLETLPANATEEMITSGFDLSLYTCTASGTSRVTVRCNAVE